MMSFGRTTIARRPTVSVGHAPGMGRGPVVGFSPRPVSRQVGVGTTCSDQAAITPPGSMQAWKYNTTAAGPIPLGGRGDATANTLVGALILTLTPIEGFTIESFEITDPSGATFLNSITIGRCNFMEGGTVNSNFFQSASTACHLLKGVNIFPNSGVVFNFGNPTLANVPVQVVVQGYPIQ